MSGKAEVAFEANDAAVSTESGPPDRPPTDAEVSYLKQRVEDTAAAVKKIRALQASLKETLAAAVAEHDAAVKAARRVA